MNMKMSIGMMDEEKAKEQLQNRLKKLGVKNSVVTEAIKENDPKEDTYETFRIVHELVRAACEVYEDTGDFKSAIKDLSNALLQVANEKPVKKTGKNVTSEGEEYEA